MLEGPVGGEFVVLPHRTLNEEKKESKQKGDLDCLARRRSPNGPSSKKKKKEK